MLQKIYEQMADFYSNIEEEYGMFFDDYLIGTFFILNF